MKKLLFVAVIGALVACGEASTETTTVDTPAAAPVEAPAAPDTTVKADSGAVAAPAADTERLRLAPTLAALAAVPLPWPFLLPLPAPPAGAPWRAG